MTESCFQQHPLDFVRDKQALVRSNGSRIPIRGTFVDKGTVPEGSTWSMVPHPPTGNGPRCGCSFDLNYKPANYDCGCLKGEEVVSGLEHRSAPHIFYSCIIFTSSYFCVLTLCRCAHSAGFVPYPWQLLVWCVLAVS